MSEKSSNSQSVRISLIPFTGPLFAIYAFFWPESFGTWFGTIVRCFRAAAGF